MVKRPMADRRLPIFGGKWFSGVRLREVREAAGLSQRELARQAGLSHEAVSRLERGDTVIPRWSTMRRLAGALGMAPERLVESTWQASADDRRTPRFSAARIARHYLREQILGGVG
jgi:transcriptional regulator with XRE-family HTH domain